MHPECVSALRAMQIETLLSLQRWVCKRCYRRSRRYKDFKRDIKKQRLLLPHRRKGDGSSDDDDDDDDDETNEGLSSDDSSQSRSSRGRRGKKGCSGGGSKQHSRGWESNTKGMTKSGGTRKRASGAFGWLTFPSRWRRSFRKIGGFGSGYETMTLRAGLEKMMRRKGGRGGMDGDARFVRWSHRCADHNCAVGHDEELVSKALQQLAIDSGDGGGVGGSNFAAPTSSYLNSGGTVGGWADLCWDLAFAFRQQPVKTAQLLATFALRFFVEKGTTAFVAATALLSSSRPPASSHSSAWALSTLTSSSSSSSSSSSGQFSWPPWLSAWLSPSFSAFGERHKRRAANTAQWWSLSALLSKLPSLVSTGASSTHSRQSAPRAADGDSSSDDEYLQQPRQEDRKKRSSKVTRKKLKRTKKRKEKKKEKNRRDGANDNYSDTDTDAADGDADDTASES